MLSQFPNQKLASRLLGKGIHCEERTLMNTVQFCTSVDPISNLKDGDVLALDKKNSDARTYKGLKIASHY